MKKEINSMNQSSKNIPFKYMTKVEIQQMAILTKNSFLKEKYRHALIASTKIDLFQLAQSNPDLTAKDVLIFYT